MTRVIIPDHLLDDLIVRTLKEDINTYREVSDSEDLESDITYQAMIITVGHYMRPSEYEDYLKQLKETEEV